jgi:hypothetical protein
MIRHRNPAKETRLEHFPITPKACQDQPRINRLLPYHFYLPSLCSLVCAALPLLGVVNVRVRLGGCITLFVL